MCIRDSIINTPEVLNGVTKKEALFRDKLNEINEKHNVFADIRGKGLLLGCALNDKYKGRAKDFLIAATKAKLMCLVAGADVIRFAPSLVIPNSDIEEGLLRFEQAIISVIGEQ